MKAIMKQLSKKKKFFNSVEIAKKVKFLTSQEKSATNKAVPKTKYAIDKSEAYIFEIACS